jgi:hypothetical protein
MTKRPSSRHLNRTFAAALLLLAAGSWAQNLPALAASAVPTTAPAPADKSATEGFPLSIASTTQGNLGKLGIGAGYVGGGPYIDEKGARVNGLHAGLSISIDGAPGLSSQPDVHEGETLMAGEYRIRVDKIVPGPSAQGTVVLRVWIQPKPKPVKAKGWLGLFGL